jgi:tRNA-modifying protein YgfZ
MDSSTAVTATAAPCVFDRSARLRMQFSGAKAAESLTGLVTNDVLALRGGDGIYACALTPKGRIIADVRIFASVGADATVETFHVDANDAAGVGFAAMIKKYVNPRLAKYVNVTDSTSCLTLSGPGSSSTLRRVLGDAALFADDSATTPFAHQQVMLGSASVRVARVPDLGRSDTFDLFCTRQDSAELLAQLTAAGATHGDDAAWHQQRVRAFRPEWGVDMDEGTLAQEANMDRLSAISYQKGCYTGQETVARVHFRGHVNRTLRQIRFAERISPPAGTSLHAADGAAIGDARSSAVADDGAHVAIAMLRREIAEGAELFWRGTDDAHHSATVMDAAAE